MLVIIFPPSNSDKQETLDDCMKKMFTWSDVVRHIMSIVGRVGNSLLQLRTEKAGVRVGQKYQGDSV